MVERTRLRPSQMLFTLYGDYIYHVGGEIWVGSLIRLMQCFGISEQSVRSELVRMCRKGYLTVRRLGKRSYYSLSPRGQEIIEVGARRIFTYEHDNWDGRWTVLTYSIPEEQREVRDRLRRDLTWLGFGALTSGVYVSPWEHPVDLPRLLETYRTQGYIQVFRADNAGPEENRALVRRCWDLDGINRAYREFLGDWEPRLQRFERDGGKHLSDQDCFVERYLLAHAYKRFPLLDPGLPRELLPPEWLGHRAAELFRTYHQALHDRAMRFFHAVYQGWPDPIEQPV
jgi:phenylacetic acid degradation operon negative regulatory protein